MRLCRKVLIYAGNGKWQGISHDDYLSKCRFLPEILLCCASVKEDLVGFIQMYSRISFDKVQGKDLCKGRIHPGAFFLAVEPVPKFNRFGSVCDTGKGPDLGKLLIHGRRHGCGSSCLANHRASYLCIHSYAVDIFVVCVVLIKVELMVHIEHDQYKTGNAKGQACDI